MKLTGIVIILVTLLSYKFVDLWSIKTHEIVKTEQQTSILRGQMTFPYTYSILVPGTAFILQKIIKPVSGTQARAFIYSYELINCFVFLFSFILLFIFFRLFFSELTSIIGLFLFLAVIPLAVSGVWPEIDILNLLLFTAGFILMFKSKDQYLPFIFLIGMLNDAAIFGLLIFYILYLHTNKKLYMKKSLIIIILSVLAGSLVYFVLRWKLAYNSPEDLFKISENIANGSSILQLWTAEVLIFTILSFKAFALAGKFFRLSFIYLSLFLILFFLFGDINGFGKFFPAYLILIPMSLQILMSESTVIKLKSSIITI